MAHVKHKVSSLLAPGLLGLAGTRFSAHLEGQRDLASILITPITI